MILQYKTRHRRHLDHLHPVVIANDRIILQKVARVVPMPLIDPKSSKRIIQQTIQMMRKKEDF